MKMFRKGLILAGFSICLLGFGSMAQAATPSLTANYQGTGSVQVIVTNANAYSPVNLYSRQSSSLWTVINNVGQTDGNGYFNQSIGLSSDGSSSPMQMYVTVGGLQSQVISVGTNSGGYYGGGCTGYNCNNSNLTLSQSTVNLNVGQSSVVTASYLGYSGYGSVYVSNNSNSYVASVSVSGNQLNIYALASGTTTMTVCQSGNTSACGSIYVTVGSTYSTGTISLSPTNLTLSLPQTSNVAIYSTNYGGTFTVSSNSNAFVAGATISGNTLYINSLAVGSTTIGVCQNGNGNQCATVYVTVTGGTTSSNNLTFSPASSNLNIGQSATVNIYSTFSNSSFYISTNSNPTVSSASVSGNLLYITANNIGNNVITVCQIGSLFCGSHAVSVSGNIYGNLSLSQTSINLNPGQSSSVTAYNPGNGLFVSSNSNPSVATYSVSGSQINLYASAVGTTTMNVCSSSSSGCANLYVTVGNFGGYISLSQSILNLNSGQSSSVIINGGGNYNVYSNTNSAIASASISGSSLSIYGLNGGTTNISVCQNGSSQCANLTVNVAGGLGYGGNTSVQLSQSSVSLTAGQTITVNASGNGGYGFYLASNSNPGAVSVSFNGSVATVYGIQNGTSNVQICQNGATACANLVVTVGSAYVYTPPVTTSTGSLQFPTTGGSSVLGASIYSNGQLISENGAVYIVYKNTKTGFSSQSVFSGLGFKLYNVQNVGSSGLADSGYTISTFRASHPWGSWIKNGKTIYFVHDSGLIPVPDWGSFISNGGSSALVVPANAWDLRLPILSSMTYNDSRLQ